MSGSPKSVGELLSKGTAGTLTKLEQMECVRDVHILVIDDDTTTCRVVREALAHPGFQIVTVSDVDRIEAAIAHRTQYQIVVLDYVLPTHTPEQVFAWLHAHQPEAEVIVISGFPSVDALQNALRAKAVDFISKPFQLLQLRQAALKSLETRGLLRLKGEALLEAIGNALRERRKQLDLTLSEMVARTGLSLGYLSHIELGKSAASIETLYRICLALGYPLAELFTQLRR